MKNLLKFIIFIFLTFVIFFIKNFYVLCIIATINIFLMLIIKISIKDFFKSFRLLIPFLFLAFLLNIVLADLMESALILFRIIICYCITYIYYKTTTIAEISYTFELLLSPLKIFKINTKNISLIVSISLCTIPILKNEITVVQNAIKSKGAKIKISNFSLVLKPILISIIKRTGEMEKALISKGFMEWFFMLTCVYINYENSIVIFLTKKYNYKDITD